MRNLKTKNYTVVGGGDSDDGFGDKIEAMGVPFKSLPVSKKAISPFADILLFLTLFKWYRYEKPDIVHHFTIKPVIYGSLAARLARVPRIINTVTGLGFVFSEKKVTLLRYLVKWLYRLALRGSHFTFFLNQDDLNFFCPRVWRMLKKRAFCRVKALTANFSRLSLSPTLYRKNRSPF